MKLTYGLLLLLVILLISCSYSPEKTAENKEVSSSETGMIYNNLLREFQVLESNQWQISPERYREINQTIESLREKNISLEKYGFLREKFQNLKLPPERPIIVSEQNSQKETEENSNLNPEIKSETEEKEEVCQSNKNPIFTHHLTTIDKITTIQTPPRLVSGYLKTHSYVDTKGARVPIYAPIDMTLTTGAFYEGGPYTLDFQISCEISLRLGHVTEPIEKIKKLFPSTPAKDSRGIDLPKKINFQAGELIAYTTGTTQAGNWDFGMYDSSSSNKYAQNKDWNNSFIYTTAVCPYDYFSPELKGEYVKKYNKVTYTNAKADGESFCS